MPERAGAKIALLLGNGHPNLEWTLAPSVLAPLAVYAGIYAWRFRNARREEGGRGAGAWRALAFAGAMVALLAAVASPLDGLGENYLFSAHMVQHILLGDIAPVLVLLALSRVIMRPATRRLMSVERRLGRLAHPFTGLVLWLVLIYVWHIPAMYDAALNSPFLHGLEHMSFFMAGIALWWPLVQPVPMRRGLQGLAALGYLVAAKMSLGVLGLYLAWGSSVTYQHYETVPRIWGLSAIDDQNVGGAIMMAEQTMVLGIALLVLFARLINRSEADELREERLEARA